jgi:hypothetical protein
MTTPKQHICMLDSGERAQANADLIAAAPDLLAACKSLIEDQNDSFYCELCDSHAPKFLSGPGYKTLTGEPLTHREGCPIVEARAAIARAEGRGQQ